MKKGVKISILFISILITSISVNADCININNKGEQWYQGLLATEDFISFIEEFIRCSSEPGLSLVKDIIEGPPSSNPENLVGANGVLYFTANDGVNGREIWTSSKEDGTTLLTNINDGGGSNPKSLVTTNNHIYFTADDGINGREIWVNTIGESSAKIIKDINFQPGISSNPNNLINHDEIVIFTANDGINGIEMWRTEGSESSTFMIDKQDIEQFGINPSGASYLRKVDDYIYFFANKEGDPNEDLKGGIEIWKTDGTSQGTTFVKDILPGYMTSLPPTNRREFANVNSHYIFIASENGVDYFLWSSDGTEQGTIQIGGLNPENFNSFAPAEIIYYSGNFALLKTDGTLGGTILLSQNTIFPHNFIVNAERHSIFDAFDVGTQSGGLWFTDGTSGATKRIHNVRIADGEGKGISVGNTFYFVGTLEEETNELWTSDGTTGGTIQLTDLNPEDAMVDNIIYMNGALYFSANDGIHGNELWKYQL